MNSKIFVDTDKKNYRICWEDKTHLLRNVGINNNKIPLYYWVDCFKDIEKKYGDNTPEMWKKFTYKGMDMRCWIHPKGGDDFSGFIVDLKDLPQEIFSQKTKKFKGSTMFECYEQAYEYVTSMIEKYAENPQNKITILENKLLQMEEENNLLKDELKCKDELLYEKDGEILDLSRTIDALYDNNFEESILSEKDEYFNRSILEDKLPSHTLNGSYHYVDNVQEWKKVIGYENNGCKYASKGFKFNHEIGINIIYYFKCKQYSPDQILKRIPSLKQTHDQPKITINNFINLWKEGKLDYAISHVQDYYGIRMDEDLFRIPLEDTNSPLDVEDNNLDTYFKIS